jgi:hypothetical protein
MFDPIGDDPWFALLGGWPAALLNAFLTLAPNAKAGGKKCLCRPGAFGLTARHDTGGRQPGILDCDHCR